MKWASFAGRKFDSKLLFVSNEIMIYKKKSAYKVVVKYECWRAGCKARVNYVPDGKCVYVKKIVPHNHGKDEDEYKKLCALNEIKKESACISGTLGAEPNAISSVRTAFRNVSEK